MEKRRRRYLKMTFSNARLYGKLDITANELAPIPVSFSK